MLIKSPTFCGANPYLGLFFPRPFGIESPIILIGGVGIEGGTGLVELVLIFFYFPLSTLISTFTIGGVSTSGGIGLLAFTINLLFPIESIMINITVKTSSNPQNLISLK